MTRADRYPTILLVTFLCVWTALAVRPWYRQDWLLENLIVFAAVPLFVLTYRSLRFSNLAYTCLFAFLVLHEVGSHYTYSEVPWRTWVQGLTNRDFFAAAGRNHYDRFVHFCYGLLILPLAWELFEARAAMRGLWRWLMPPLFVMSHSVIYELVEWLAAEIFGGDLGVAYLGTQGDVWDAQKDMALAAGGALLSTTLMALRLARGPAD